MKVSEADIKADYTILNKHLRINELLHEYSRFCCHFHISHYQHNQQHNNHDHPDHPDHRHNCHNNHCFSDAQMIFLTLPQQKQGKTKAGLFMAAIDVMTRSFMMMVIMKFIMTSTMMIMKIL